MIRENGLGVRIPLTALINIGRYANWRSRRSVKPLPSGVVGSNPALPIYMPQSLSWWRSCLEDSRPVIPACRFKSCLRRYHIWRRVLTGRQPVPNTGDPKGFGGSKSPFHSGRRRAEVPRTSCAPPSSLISRFGRIGKCTCPLSRGRLIRHPGSGPGSGAHPGSN